MEMFGIFNRSNNQPQQQEPPSPMQDRLMIVVDQYSSQIPLTVRPMLSGLLHGLKGKMTDEKILMFVQHTKQLLDYVEHGDALPFDDLGGDDHERDRQ